MSECCNGLTVLLSLLPLFFFTVAREKISQTFRDAMGDSYSSSNPYKRKRRSFEKKHNAIVDIIKQRSDTSSTSMAQPGVSNSPSPPSRALHERLSGDLLQLPQLASHSSRGAPVVAARPLIPAHQQQQQKQNSSPLDMNKFPGQIGFARRLSMQMGMSAGQFRSATSPQHHEANRGFNQTSVADHPLLVGSRDLANRDQHSVPHLAASHFFLSPAVAGRALYPIGVPFHRRSSLPGAYDPALMIELVQRQRLQRNSDMMGASTLPGL